MIICDHCKTNGDITQCCVSICDYTVRTLDLCDPCFIQLTESLRKVVNNDCDIPGEYRNEIVRTLRVLCAEFGDNDWPDTLHLPDAIEKHLGRHLRTQEKGQ